MSYNEYRALSHKNIDARILRTPRFDKSKAEERKLIDEDITVYYSDEINMKEIFEFAENIFRSHFTAKQDEELEIVKISELDDPTQELYFALLINDKVTAKKAIEAGGNFEYAHSRIKTLEAVICDTLMRVSLSDMHFLEAETERTDEATAVKKLHENEKVPDDFKNACKNLYKKMIDKKIADK